MTSNLVEASATDGVGQLHLVHAAKRNAISHALADQALEAMDGLVKAGVRVAVLSAEPPVFCAGNDLEELGSLADVAGTAVSRLINGFLNRPIFWIAAVNGAALGGGMALAGVCPLAIVSERAWFSLPELQIGILPAGVLPYLEVVMGTRRALDAGVTGRRIDPPEAVALGLAKETVTPDDLDPHTFTLGADLASRPSVTDAARQAWQERFTTTAFGDRQSQFEHILKHSIEQPEPSSRIET